MATVETGGAGGKFRKKPIRRSQATPYDRPPTALRPTLLDSGQRENSNGWLSKFVDPASRLITAGAHKFFSSVFRKRILPPPDETRESGDMQREITPMVVHSGSKEPIGRDNDPTKVSSSGEVAELEDIFKQKTFTRSEIDHLTTLLLSRAVDSSVEVDKGRSNPIFSDEEAVHNSSEIVASFPTLEKGAERVAISTPVMISKVVEDVASPAELAKAYMGSRSSRASPSISVLQNEILKEDLSTPNNSFLQRKSQANSLIQKHTSDIGASSNGFMTPQLRGRSAIYNMASTPYSRPRPTQVLKAAKTDLKVHSASSSYNITETQQLSGSKRQVLKRRSSVLESDIGFVGPIRRIRQKPSLLHHKILSLPPAGAAHVKHVSERLTDVDKLPSSIEWSSNNHFSSKALPDTGVRSKSNGYVPSQSIRTAEKIFEHLDKITSKGMSPEKKIDVVGGSSPVQKASDICDVSPHKSSSTVDSLNVLKTNDSRKESGLFESNVNALDRSPKISQRVDEGSLKRFSFVEDAAEAVSLKKSMENVNPESSSDDQQKKQKFQMSAHEDYLELDKVNTVGGACTPMNKVVESHALTERSVGISFNAPESTKSSAGRPPAPETNPSTNLLCANIEVSLPDGSAATQKSTAFSFPVASSSSSATNHSTQEAVSSPLLAVAAVKTAIQSGKSNEIPAFNSNGANFAPHLFSPSSIVQSASVKDMKTELPSSASGAVAKTDERDRTDKNISFDASKKMDTPSSAVGFAKGSISSGVLSNGAQVSNGLPGAAPMPMGASSPIQVSSTSNDQSPVPVSSSAPFSFSNGNALFTSIAASTAGTPIASNLSTYGSSTSHLSSSTTAAPALFESSFQSGFTAVSSISSTVVTTAFESASKSGAASNDTAFGNVTSGLFTAKPSVTASVGNAGSVFNASTFKPASPVSNGFTFTPQAPASTVAVTTSASASSLFGSSGSVGFNASASTFSYPFTSSSTSGSSVSSSSTMTAPISSSSMFGWQSPNPTAPFGTSQSTGFTFGLKAPGTSSDTNSTPIVFGATPTSSTASKTAPFVFGSSSSAASIFSSPSPAMPTSTAPTTPFPSQPAFGSSTPQPFSFSSTPVGNNDQMSMEHSMAEDSVQVSTSTAPVFGAPISAPSSGFVFGGAAPAPSTASPFQFGGQQNQFGPQNTPFQPSGSIELNNGGAGSFSLGSGGVDSKANRRIIKVKNRIRKK